MTELTSAVREAQADADRRFGDGPVQPWEPPPVLSEATRRRLAVVAVASVLATALLVAIAVAKATPAAEPMPRDPLPPLADAPADDDAGPAPPSPVPSMPAAAPSLALERQGADWQLSARGVARDEVVQRLAEASGATLHGWPDAAAGARPVQLHWQGRSLAQLWPIVLGPELNFALQCRRERCDVWILGAVRPAPAAIAPSPPSASFEPPALPLPMPGADEDNTPIRD
ncbi:hypothetical protein FSC37_22875 [Piscinibacter aquaticus]|uniref:Uncharacterized protein n=1 Tax=Piscinibacter aquaticus TaxID=392597 RepID=A0A5C6TPX8_9BURK|nr:hypothetical protein FSC37_22875 [Piscinibacter aquaticus]